MATHAPPDRPAPGKRWRSVSLVRTAPARPTFPTVRYRRLAVALMFPTGCTIALAACGSSNPASTSATGSSYSQLAAAHCMRAHGVPNFPDPGPHGGMTVLMSPGSSTVTIDGTPFSGPAFQAAERICHPLGIGGAGNPSVSEHQRRALLDFAKCMRQHRIPYSDPTFPPGGGIFGGGASGPDTSPASKPAGAICTKAVARETAG
jgi:hypothetical protein